MSVDTNKALVRRYIEEVWHAGQPALPFFAPDYRRYVGPTSPPLSGAEQEERIRGFRAAFPDLRFAVESLIGEGDRVVFQCTLRGTHRGPFAGHAPTGRAMVIGLIDIVRIAGDRLVEHWGGPDLHALHRELGLPLTPPGGPPGPR
jgi:predicted ester cyclase